MKLPRGNWPRPHDALADRAQLAELGPAAEFARLFVVLVLTQLLLHSAPLQQFLEAAERRPDRLAVMHTHPDGHTFALSIVQEWELLIVAGGFVQATGAERFHDRGTEGTEKKSTCLLCALCASVVNRSSIPQELRHLVPQVLDLLHSFAQIGQQS